MGTAKYKFQRLVFNPANQKLIDLLDELQKLAKNALVVAVQMSHHLKKSKNETHLEIGKYEEVVSHLERELVLNGLEAPDEMQKKTL